MVCLTILSSIFFKSTRAQGMIIQITAKTHRPPTMERPHFFNQPNQSPGTSGRPTTFTASWSCRMISACRLLVLSVSVLFLKSKQQNSGKTVLFCLHPTSNWANKKSMGGSNTCNWFIVVSWRFANSSMAQAVAFPCFKIRQAKACMFILFTQGPTGVSDEIIKYRKSVGRWTVGLQEPSNFAICTLLLSRCVTLTKSVSVGAQAFSRPMEHSPLRNDTQLC